MPSARTGNDQAGGEVNSADCPVMQQQTFTAGLPFRPGVARQPANECPRRQAPGGPSRRGSVLYGIPYAFRSCQLRMHPMTSADPFALQPLWPLHSRVARPPAMTAARAGGARADRRDRAGRAARPRPRRRERPDQPRHHLHGLFRGRRDRPHPAVRLHPAHHHRRGMARAGGAA